MDCFNLLSKDPMLTVELQVQRLSFSVPVGLVGRSASRKGFFLFQFAVFGGKLGSMNSLVAGHGLGTPIDHQQQ